MNVEIQHGSLGTYAVGFSVGSQGMIARRSRFLVNEI